MYVFFSYNKSYTLKDIITESIERSSNSNNGEGKANWNTCQHIKRQLGLDST